MMDPAQALGEAGVGALELRAALSRYATGVTIVAALDAQGRPFGLTVNSFNALSLEPPLVLWSLRLQSPSVAAFVAAGAFSINVLAEAQLGLSRHFAARGEHIFAPDDWAAGEHGLPCLQGASAVLECSLESHQLAGDHMLFIGRVLATRQGAQPPLVYQVGHYHALGYRL